MKNLWSGRIEKKRLKQIIFYSFSWMSPVTMLGQSDVRALPQHNQGSLGAWTAKSTLQLHHGRTANQASPHQPKQLPSPGAASHDSFIPILGMHRDRDSTAEVAEAGLCRDNAPQGGKRKAVPKGACSCPSKSWSLPTLRNYPCAQSTSQHG